MKNNKVKSIVNYVLLILGCLLLFTLWITELCSLDNLLQTTKAFIYLGIWVGFVFIVIFLIRMLRKNKRF